MRYRLPKGFSFEGAKLLICSYPDGGKAGFLRPYEAQVYQF
jgi:hypothetical protein